jgi:hypothetical protein
MVTGVAAATVLAVTGNCGRTVGSTAKVAGTVTLELDAVIDNDVALAAVPDKTTCTNCVAPDDMLVESGAS